MLKSLVHDRTRRSLEERTITKWISYSPCKPIPRVVSSVYYAPHLEEVEGILVLAFPFVYHSITLFENGS